MPKDEQVTKALEICGDIVDTDCEKCPYVGKNCVARLVRDAFHLVKRLKTKSEVKSNDWLIKGISKEQLEEERALALKESTAELFAINLKERGYISADGDKVVKMQDIDNLLKEWKKQAYK